MAAKDPKNDYGLQTADPALNNRSPLQMGVS
jgi:hypothetical protein